MGNPLHPKPQNTGHSSQVVLVNLFVLAPAVLLYLALVNMYWPTYYWSAYTGQLIFGTGHTRQVVLVNVFVLAPAVLLYLASLPAYPVLEMANYYIRCLGFRVSGFVFRV